MVISLSLHLYFTFLRKTVGKEIWKCRRSSTLRSLPDLSSLPLQIYKNLLFPLGRILTGCYWFCILIWVSTYTANLAAFLTVKNAHQPISSLEDLAESSYQLLLLNSSSTYEELKNSNLETHRRVWRRIKKDDIVSTTSLAIQKVREKKDFAFIHDGPVLQYAASQQPCDLTISKCT